MKEFMNENFMLNTDVAVKLFHGCAKTLPIIDYHCHINPAEIANDKKFENITSVWLGGDHYKWRLMRAAGVDEKYITGDGSDREKFQKYAETISRCIGNPVFHWTHLELQRYFGYHGVLSGETAEEVWSLCNDKLKSPDMSVKNLIKKSNVRVICTTDDPVDTLEWHKSIAEDKSFDVRVLPAWRPDKIMNAENPEFIDYIEKLSEKSGIDIKNLGDLKSAVKNRMEFFASMGCCVSDHALEYVDYLPASDEEINEILTKRLKGGEISELEIRRYKTAFMLFCAREYSKMGWVMQLHYGCKRNNNPLQFEILGPDTGYDCINNYAPSSLMADFLGSLSKERALPKTIIYSLNPNDNAAIDTIAGCFQDGSCVNKIQHGSAWWFNDHNSGMREQMISLANEGFLAGFVGMLTDSRSFLSYPRHEYFRRILCNLIGEWVENGEYPDDMSKLSKIVSDISYYNTKNYFGF
ncbi:MAG: glucuronate isomerase [Eubacterium sp.]|jgi:glucuronate isomerase|nr:glucuronate isomerase [Eubacterium sp.]